jgi:hypothetical protein
MNLHYTEDKKTTTTRRTQIYVKLTLLGWCFTSLACAGICSDLRSNRRFIPFLSSDRFVYDISNRA